METSKGAFLKEKGNNMRQWLRQEMPLTKAILAFPEVTEIEAVYLGNCLSEQRAAVYSQSFADLIACEDLTDEFRDALIVIEERPGVHAKFWRYMHLFVEVVEQ